MSKIKDVSRLAGASVGTVSHFLNATRPVSAELGERVLKAAEQLRYRPNLVARGLRSKRTGILGMLISNIENPFFTELVAAVQHAALAQGYQVLVCNSYEDPEAESQHLTTLRNYQIDGLIIAPTAGEHPQLAAFSAEGLPIVLVNRRLAGHNWPTVIADNYAAARLVIEHFIELGHWRIGVLLTLPDVSLSQDRAAGYFDALNAHGLSADPRWVVYGGTTYERGAEAARALLSGPSRPTAVFCASLATTLAALLAAREACLSIPADLAIVASGNFPWASLLQPPLTTVTQPTWQVGLQAVDQLLTLVRARAQGVEPPAGPTLTVLPVGLIHGGSCGCASSPCGGPGGARVPELARVQD